MNIIEESVMLPTATGAMRTVILRPSEEGSYPCLVLYSEIFQLTGPIMRSAATFAGHGFVVALPEIYYENLPAGKVLKYDDEDKAIGNQLKIDTSVTSYDGGLQAIIDFMKTQQYCSGRMGTVGFCLGGHLAFRGGLHPDVAAAACFYATDLHKTNSLGADDKCDTFDRMSEINGEVMMLWGRQDPHVPNEGRAKIYNELVQQDVNFTWHEFNAAHAFMRDEGHRYNPSLAHDCHTLAVGMLNRVLKV